MKLTESAIKLAPLAAILCGGATLLTVRSAHADFQIVITADSSPAMTAQRLAAIQLAANYWQSRFDDPITVRIRVRMDDLGGSPLASTSLRTVTMPYDVVRPAMYADAEPGTEKSKVNQLPVSSLPIIDSHGIRDDEEVTMASANAKALNLGIGPDPSWTVTSGWALGMDATITFDSATSWDTNRTNGIATGTYDLTGVALHEIGHALGFTSQTDKQDALSVYFPLNPSTLDIWRFECLSDATCSAIDLASSPRLLTAAPARYYDDVLGIRMSRGVNSPDLLYCAACPDACVDCDDCGGYCQASHWRDDQGNLMDPTVATGQLHNIHSDDVHALDYIGYSRSDAPTASVNVQAQGAFGFMLIGELAGQLPNFGPLLNGFPPPPSNQVINPPPSANVGVLLALDCGPEIGQRTALGYLRYTPQAPIPPGFQFIPPDQSDGWENLDPPGEYMTSLPAAIHDVLLVTESAAGPQITFTSTASVSGIQRELHTGQFGVYRITGFLDGAGDGVAGDVDGVLTLTMRADQWLVPMPQQHNSFVTDPGDVENHAIVYDELAFGIEPACPADIDGDGGIGINDLLFLINHWGQGAGDPADINGSGLVDVDDLLEVINHWGEC